MYFTINLTQAKGSLSVNFISYFTVIHTKTYIFHVSTLPKSICDKTMAKKRWSLPKTMFCGVETTLLRTFSSGDLQCLPPDDPRVLCANTGIRLLATHSLISQLSKVNFLTPCNWWCPDFVTLLTWSSSCVLVKLLKVCFRPIPAFLWTKRKKKIDIKGCEPRALNTHLANLFFLVIDLLLSENLYGTCLWRGLNSFYSYILGVSIFFQGSFREKQSWKSFWQLELF